MALAERLYLQDAKLLRFHATVTDIREYSRRDGAQVWHLALDRTAFYPTGGGQPHDRGVLRAESRSGALLEALVEDVAEDEAGEVWHATAKPLPAGTEVEGEIDGERRLDHRQQHSGQHLLSAVLADEFGARTGGFHLGDEDATVDLQVDGKALLDQLPEVERRVNRLIAENLPLTVRVVAREEAEALLRSGAVRKLPEREGPIRLVEMPGIDLNACGGTHVGALGEIGSVLLRGTERVKGGLRLHFCCGGRAVRAARADWTELQAAASALSVGASGVAAAAARLQAEGKALGKERQKLREEIAADHAVRLAIEEHIEGGLRLVVRSYADRDAEYVKLLARKLLDAVPQTAAILASTVAEPATLVVACNLEGNTACDTLLREALAPLGSRGGGTAELAQTQVPAGALPELMKSLKRGFRRS